MFPMLYKTFVRPILEYVNVIWGPFYITDQQNIEKVQKRATRMVASIRHLPYTRLKILKLATVSSIPSHARWHDFGLSTFPWADKHSSVIDMPKQKKKRFAPASAPYAASTKTNDTSEVSSETTESQNSESLHCGVCTTGVDYIVVWEMWHMVLPYMCQSATTTNWAYGRL